MISRYQLRYFLAIVETGNFSRAAARANVTQPTLSVGVAKLEQELGAKLFFRNSQRVHLTEAGNRLLTHARAIEGEFHQIEKKLAGDEPRPLLRLGVLTTLPTSLLERIVQRYSADPDAGRLELLEGSERDLLNRLDRGRIDLALTVLRSKGRFAQKALFREGYALAVPARHRHAQSDVVEGEDLAQDVMIVRRHCEALAATSRYFTDRGVRPEFSFRSTNDDKVLAMVRAGLGITVMPQIYDEAGVFRPRLAGFDMQREIGVLYRAENLDIGDCALFSAIRAETDRHADPR